MKNIFKFLSVFVLVLLLTGCFDKKDVSKCTLNNDQSASGYTINSTYNIYSTNGVVNSVETKEIVTSENTTILAYFEDLLKKQYEAANKSYGGYKFEVSKSDKKVTSTVSINYDKMDLAKFIKDNTAMKSYVNKSNKLTLEGAKKLYESLGATCK